MAPRRTRTRSQPEALLPLLTPQLPPTLERRSTSGEALGKLLDRINDGDEERRSFKERRATPRVAVGLAVEAASGAKSQRVVTHDLSTFGLSISGGPTPKKGTRLKLKLTLPDAPEVPLVLEGVVLGALDAAGGIRVRFVQPPLEAVRRIHKLVK